MTEISKFSGESINKVRPSVKMDNATSNIVSEAPSSITSTDKITESDTETFDFSSNYIPGITDIEAVQFTEEEQYDSFIKSISEYHEVVYSSKQALEDVKKDKKITVNMKFLEMFQQNRIWVKIGRRKGVL